MPPLLAEDRRPLALTGIGVVEGCDASGLLGCARWFEDTAQPQTNELHHGSPHYLLKLKSADKRSKLEERGIPAALGGKWSAVQVAVAGGGQPFRGCKRRRRVKK